MEKNIPSKMNTQMQNAFSECRYKSENDIANRFISHYKHYREGNPDVKEEFMKICSPQDRIDIVCLGFYLSVKSGDFTRLNDALFTYNRLTYTYYKQLNVASHYGGDCYYVLPIVYAYAGNDNACAAYYFSKYGNYAKKGHRYTKTIANLILSCFKKNTEMMEKAVDDAHRFLSKKNTLYTQAVVQFLVSVIENEYVKMNESFSLAVNAYIKEKSIHQSYNDLFKYIPIELYGIAKFAEIILGTGFYQKFQQPESDIWWSGFFEIVKAGKVGGDFVSFDGQLRFLMDTLHEL